MQPTIVARPFHVEGFVYGSNDDFAEVLLRKALLRRLLAGAVEEGRLRGYRARLAPPEAGSVN
jgi:hypothetical protein